MKTSKVKKVWWVDLTTTDWHVYSNPERRPGWIGPFKTLRGATFYSSAKDCELSIAQAERRGKMAETLRRARK